MLDEGYGFEAVTGMVLDRLAMYGDTRHYYAGLFGVYAVAVYCPAPGRQRVRRRVLGKTRRARIGSLLLIHYLFGC